jgi:hypothetical protein
MIGALAIAACIGIGATVVPIEGEDDAAFRKRVPKIPHQTLKGCPASINRHTGEPHRHSREIARRKRQKARGEA